MFHLTRQAVALNTRRMYSTVGPARVGAFRGGIIGFFAGVTVTGAAAYVYLIDEINKANQVVLIDVLSLKDTVNSLEKHVKALEK